MKKKISNLLFDFGCVLLDLYPQRTVEAMQTLLGIPYDAYHQSVPECFRQFETGQITQAAFIRELSSLSGRKVIRQEFEVAWNAMLGDVPTVKWDALIHWKNAGYRLFLFSNTNETHLSGVENIMGMERFKVFESLFEQCFYSHKIGKRKPDPESFRYILSETGIKASETLFIDDGIMHIEGAKQAGIKALHYQAGEDLFGKVQNQLT